MNARDPVAPEVRNFCCSLANILALAYESATPEEMPDVHTVAGFLAYLINDDSTVRSLGSQFRAHAGVGKLAAERIHGGALLPALGGGCRRTPVREDDSRSRCKPVKP